MSLIRNRLTDKMEVFTLEPKRSTLICLILYEKKAREKKSQSIPTAGIWFCCSIIKCLVPFFLRFTLGNKWSRIRTFNFVTQPFVDFAKNLAKCNYYEHRCDKKRHTVNVVTSRGLAKKPTTLSLFTTRDGKNIWLINTVEKNDRNSMFKARKNNVS